MCERYGFMGAPGAPSGCAGASPVRLCLGFPHNRPVSARMCGWWWRGNGSPLDAPHAVKRPKNKCHLSTLASFFNGVDCVLGLILFQHITALILQLSPRPLTASRQLLCPPLLRPSVRPSAGAVYTDMYKQTQTKSKIPSGPDSLRRLCVCNRSCGLFVERLGGSDY